MAVYVKSNSLVCKVNEFIWWNGNHLVDIEVHAGGEQFTVRGVYSPPPVALDVGLRGKVNLHHTVIAGDFNSRTRLLGYPKGNPSGKALEEILDGTNLSMLQSCETPTTHIHSGGTHTRPDVTLVSSDLKHRSVMRVLDSVGSDHLPILTEIGTVVPTKTVPISHWKFGTANWPKFTRKCDTQIAATAWRDKTLYEKVRWYTKALLRASDKSIKRVKTSCFRPLWSKRLKRAIKKRTAARNRYLLRPTQKTKLDWYRSNANCRYVAAIDAKRKWRATCAGLNKDSSNRTLWAKVRKLRSAGVEPHHPLTTAAGQVGTPSNIAKELNRQYAEVNMRPTPIPGDDQIRDQATANRIRVPPMADDMESPFSLDQLKAVIDATQKGKAAGPDGIHIEMVKHVSDFGLSVLTEIMNESWITGDDPPEWKKAIIRPIPKSGKPRSSAKGYRPISLLSVLGKLLDSLVQKRLAFHLEREGKLSEFQTGFRAGRQCPDPVVRLCQDVADAMCSDPPRHVGAVFFDLQQAYDRVWRDGLRVKLRQKGVGGRMYRWLDNFLEERQISTRFAGEVSSYLPLEEGLPQGSPLSCVLFVVFIDDSVDGLLKLKILVALYVDDLGVWVIA
ncbi:MAG: hypothetical protein GY703_12615, partial [Gammaproteobacteria bacterium]|nr:hypothetical protein [Gammaproteobacteria bacterium]